MNAQELGVEGFSDEDRNFQGSCFRQVRAAIFSNPYQKSWGNDTEPALPRHEVLSRHAVTGLLSRGGAYFLQAARRTVDSRADLRWGTDLKGFRRIVHPNGVCLTGLWEISEDTDYSGYFKQDSRGLVVARYSTCCSETGRGHTRSLSMAGLLYPTTDRESGDVLPTASFFTQEDIGGANTTYVNDAELRNAPNITATRRGILGFPLFLATGLYFVIADREPGVRQLYEIAELGKSEDQPTRTPEFFRLLMADDQPRIEGEALDFRDEIMAQIYDKGDPDPQRKLVFHIEVSDQGTKKGIPAYLRRAITGWRRLGRITFEDATVSYNGDFVFHVHHPSWRDDRNDPATAVRQNGRKVR